MAHFPGKSTVAAPKTTSATGLDDIRDEMHRAGFEAAFPVGIATSLKVHFPWRTWDLACSSTLWQIEAIIQALRAASRNDPVSVSADTVVLDTCVGGPSNRHRFATVTGVMKDTYGQAGLPTRELSAVIRPAVGLIALAAAGSGKLRP